MSPSAGRIPPVSPSLLLFVAVLVVFAIADRWLTRRSGVPMPDLWAMLLVVAIAIVKSSYADRLPFDDWGKGVIWIILIAVPYLALHAFHAWRMRPASASGPTDESRPPSS
jgi:hypothetical protein